MQYELRVTDKQQVLDQISQEIESGLPVHIEISKQDETYVVSFVELSADSESADGESDDSDEEDFESAEESAD